MGLSPFASCFKDGESFPEMVRLDQVQPNIKNFEIRRYSHDGGYTAVEVYYPNIGSRFEATKIMVFWTGSKGIDVLRERESLDPHFSEGDDSPLARFAPTDQGWSDAHNFMRERRKDWQ